MNRFALAFRWAMILGILQDWFFALPGLFIPNAVVGLGGADPVLQPSWPAYACALLAALSIAYFPAAADPLGNLAFSILAVLARVGGATFFFVLWPGHFPALFGTLDLSFAIIQGVLLGLAVLAGPPVERDDPRAPATLWPLLVKFALVVALLAVVAGTLAWFHLFRRVPQGFDWDSDPVAAFKHGSVGTEDEAGLPYWIWLVLPRVFPEHLPGPGGYASLGIVWEQGQDMPVGFSKKTIGFARVGINCALCHTGTYRLRAEDVPTVVPAAPTTRFDALAYQRFLFACASDPRFSPDVLMEAIGYEVKLPFVEQQLYRRILIPQTKKALLKQKDNYSWTHTRPVWGAGRIDPFNPVKYTLLEMDPGKDPSVGNSDMMPLWNRLAREGHSLHWDGLNTSLTEVMDSGAIGDGATYKSLPVPHMRRMEKWLMDLSPPAYPLPVDRALAEKGRAVFARSCAACHATGAKLAGETKERLTGKVIDLPDIGTDANRIGMWSQDAADRYNTKAAGYPFAFKSFVKRNGYLAVPLDGLWLRGPYLHNGSVPTVADLLEPMEKRPTEFWRGYDVLDGEKIGFVSGPAAQKAGGWRYRIDVQGNGNGGHTGAKYGTTLPAAEKKALIEYLKTL